MCDFIEACYKKPLPCGKLPKNKPLSTILVKWGTTTHLENFSFLLEVQWEFVVWYRLRNGGRILISSHARDIQITISVLWWTHRLFFVHLCRQDQKRLTRLSTVKCITALARFRFFTGSRESGHFISLSCLKPFWSSCWCNEDRSKRASSFKIALKNDIDQMTMCNMRVVGSSDEPTENNSFIQLFTLHCRHAFDEVERAGAISWEILTSLSKSRLYPSVFSLIGFS